MAEPPSPRRIGRPKWLNMRVVGGMVILIVAVAVGAKVVGSASRTSAVWVAAHDLAAGTVVEPDDVTAADVNLGGHDREYVGVASAVEGRVLQRPLADGELVPVAALTDVDDRRVVSIPVEPDRMAPGVTHGSVIDLYLVTARRSPDDDGVSTRIIQRGATVQSVEQPASGGLSGAISSVYRVALRLPADEADALVRQLPHGDVVVVLHTGDPVPVTPGG